jgi:hypothetical protein
MMGINKRSLSPLEIETTIKPGEIYKLARKSNEVFPFGL